MRFSFPITKIEKQADGSLLVGGCATDESIDSQGDILDFGGSVKAFEGWRGNVREAHDPKKPVGKALNVTFDETRKAIDVEAFISAGAPETQQKLLDGVLRSFSVGGGNPTKVRMEKVGDKMVRRVLEWPMSELSVVDVGANPNANIELVKADGVATEALAVEAVPVPEPEAKPEPNRFAEKLTKAIEDATPAPAAAPVKTPAPVETKAEEPGTKKGDESGVEEESQDGDAICPKCMKVHKDGMEECMKEELAAPAEMGKAEEPVEVKKAFEEWDIRQALDILEGLQSLLFNESAEEGEPPAEKVALESAITNVKAFIASEARELAASGIEASAKPSLVKMFAAALDARDAKLIKTFEEKITKSAAPAAPADIFKVTDGDQLAEGIGKGLSTALAPIAKAHVELKGFIEAELKDVRKSIVELGKTAAVPMPLRTVPREEILPRRVSVNEVETLEKALSTATHPEAQVYLRQQIALAKARPQG